MLKFFYGIVLPPLTFGWNTNRIGYEFVRNPCSSSDHISKGSVISLMYFFSHLTCAAQTCNWPDASGASALERAAAEASVSTRGRCFSALPLFRPLPLFQRAAPRGRCFSAVPILKIGQQQTLRA